MYNRCGTYRKKEQPTLTTVLQVSDIEQTQIVAKITAKTQVHVYTHKKK